MGQELTHQNSEPTDTSKCITQIKLRSAKQISATQIQISSNKLYAMIQSITNKEQKNNKRSDLAIGIIK